METATAIRAVPQDETSSRVRRSLLAVAGPALIVVSVLVALRGFAFLPRLSNQHPDILTFWLPRSCLMGDALSAARVPLWNPFEMAGTPFAADTQSGWLSVPTMIFSWTFGCGGALRALIVLHPILAGVGLWWFLRKEGIGRLASTAGGLSIAMAMSASNIAISLPFAGTLAWTPLALVGASGFFSAVAWRRLGWLALAAFAWGQVAADHLSHGLLMCTALVVAYVIARSVHEVRRGAIGAGTAILLSLGFLAFLPLANLAILVPRFALLARSSLRVGYGALEGTVARSRAVERPIPEHGIWSAWPLALASTPGASVGAAMLLAVPLAFLDRARRYLVLAIAAVGAIGYVLTLTLLVGAGWFRSFVLWLPFGDVYLHNPGRLRYLAFLAVPALGAIGVQALVDRRPSFAKALRWLSLGFAVFLLFPLLVGAKPARLAVTAIGVGAVLIVVWFLTSGRRWAPVALVGVLGAELVAGALWSSAYRGGTIYFGLEGDEHPALVHGPLRWPNVDLDRYLEPGPIAREIARGDGRYLAWVPPAAYFNKGYLFSQDEPEWPALLLGRAILFGLHDALGYSPIQVPRYWSYVRATNRLPVFYNAAVIQEPSPEDVRLLGIRYLIVHEGQEELPTGITGVVVESERGFLLVDLDGAQPRASVVPSWTVVADGAIALEAVLERGFDPAATAVVEGDPGIEPAPDAAPGTATYAERRPEDVRISARTTSPALVVVRNTWERGWEATVDGRPAPLLRADSFLQAVPVPAGEHDVRLVYREPAIGLGLLGSGIAWAAFAAALALVAARSTRRPARRAA